MDHQRVDGCHVSGLGESSFQEYGAFFKPRTRSLHHTQPPQCSMSLPTRAATTVLVLLQFSSTAGDQCAANQRDLDASIASGACDNPRGGWLLPESCTDNCIGLIVDWLCACNNFDDQWWTYVVGVCVAHSPDGRMNASYTPAGCNGTSPPPPPHPPPTTMATNPAPGAAVASSAPLDSAAVDERTDATASLLEDVEGVLIVGSAIILTVCVCALAVRVVRWRRGAGRHASSPLMRPSVAKPSGPR